MSFNFLGERRITMRLKRFYRTPFLSKAAKRNLIQTFNQQATNGNRRIRNLMSEICYYLELKKPLSEKEMDPLRFLLAETFEPDNFSETSFLGHSDIIETGPRLNHISTWCMNAIQGLMQCGVESAIRIEHSCRYFPVMYGKPMSEKEIELFLSLTEFDRMTEMVYEEPLRTFESLIQPDPVLHVPIINPNLEEVKDFAKKLRIDLKETCEQLGIDIKNLKGNDVLRIAANGLGLAFDDFDIKHIMGYFIGVLNRNPTDVELFQYGQANSDHSRHHRFNGRIIIDGKEMPHTLMDLIKTPHARNPGETLIAFKDNASVTEGPSVRVIVPEDPTGPSPLKIVDKRVGNTADAETHNYPSAVAPFPGAATGTGGRIRDDIGVGKGGIIGGNTSGYMVGNLNIPSLPFPWEIFVGEIPSTITGPLGILIGASNGASDYCNKFGIPLIGGMVRSFDMRMLNDERRAYLKCIMFTSAIGYILDEHLYKETPKKGMWIVLLGGPSLRIGVGGGSASSMGLGENVAELDWFAVQRDDAEMENRVYAALKACDDMGPDTPIKSIHDLGAGGNCNAITEIIETEGGIIYLDKLPIGDPTLGVREIWGNESQERMVVLVDDEGLVTLQKICEREKCPIAVVGEITGDGKLILMDERDGSTPVNMDMSFALGEIPQKTYEDETPVIVKKPLEIPKNLDFKTALLNVLAHPDVSSKKYLTVKADRSVGGRVVQQQCVGPLHIPLADYGMMANGFFDKSGYAESIGQTPIIGLLDIKAMARMSVGEALTNIMFANGTGLKDINLLVNAMWPAAQPGEIANYYMAYEALRDFQLNLEIRTDGGKDSSSMFALALNPNGGIEIVKIPNTLVITARMPCPDTSRHLNVTPDIKRPGESHLMFIDLSAYYVDERKRRLGASIFARTLNQIGDVPPDVDHPEILEKCFAPIQGVKKGRYVLAGHDVSDGGLATTLCEMAIGGNCGLTADLKTSKHGLLSDAFAEELGLVIEYLPENLGVIREMLERNDLGNSFEILGQTTKQFITLNYDREQVFRMSKHNVRAVWEKTGHMLDMLQANPDCVREEMESTRFAPDPCYKLPDNLEVSPSRVEWTSKPKLAVLREEGKNAHEEMAAAFLMAGFDVMYVAMTDIIHGRIDLENFQMVVDPGGFTFSDVFGAGKAQSGTVLFNKVAKAQFSAFYAREKTLSFGVCNGCQDMALIGWVPWSGIPIEKQPRFIRNTSERFECRFPTVLIKPSPSVMLKGLEGASLGVWVRHGEGRFFCPDEDMLKDIEGRLLAPIRFTEDGMNPTERYQYNPNGSPRGITGLVTPDGRHLAMMPHPEALLTPEVWPWMPVEWSGMEESPWMRIFHNARAFFG
jgi:phosphoribosylformylglycinamidine synthase